MSLSNEQKARHLQEISREPPWGVLHLENSCVANEMVKGPRQATIEYPPPRPPGGAHDHYATSFHIGPPQLVSYGRAHRQRRMLGYGEHMLGLVLQWLRGYSTLYHSLFVARFFTVHATILRVRSGSVETSRESSQVGPGGDRNLMDWVGSDQEVYQIARVRPCPPDATRPKQRGLACEIACFLRVLTFAFLYRCHGTVCYASLDEERGTVGFLQPGKAMLCQKNMNALRVRVRVGVRVRVCWGKPPRSFLYCQCNSPVAPIDFDRHISGCRLTQTALLGTPIVPSTSYCGFGRQHALHEESRVLSLR